MLNITNSVKEEELTVALEGRLDTTTAPQLEDSLHASLEGTEKLVFDLEKLQYISSAGLRVLLSAQKMMNKKSGMVIRNASDEVREIFEVTGFSDILTIED
ncbi:MAG: STAS domain-containing protein [Lachnospiraceae bacterium]|nr:STAS domain-containing protein [Lachnospiraceae bacterium]